MASKNITYDDRDQSHLKYQDYWFHEGSWNASRVRKTGTLSSTERLEANVTFTFPEPANAFYYYGIPRCCGGMYAICIDCDPNAPNFISIDGVDPTDDGQNPPVVLFAHTFDEYGIHEIILKNENDTRWGHSQLTIDRFVLQVEDSNVKSESESKHSTTSIFSSVSSAPVDFTPTSEPVASASASFSSTSTAPVDFIPTTEPVASASASFSSTSTTPIGPIVGGAVGGAVLLALLTILFLYCRRRRSPGPPHIETNRTQPFVLPQPTGSQSALSKLRNLTSGATLTGSSFSATGMNSGALTSGKRSGTTPSPLPTTQLPRTIIRRETDAGPAPVLPDDADSGSATLPPEYEQVFRNGTANGGQAGTSNRPSMSQIPVANRATGSKF